MEGDKMSDKVSGIYIIGVDISQGDDTAIAVVSKQRGPLLEVAKVFHGEQAIGLYEALTNNRIERKNHHEQTANNRNESVQACWAEGAYTEEV